MDESDREDRKRILVDLLGRSAPEINGPFTVEQLNEAYANAMASGDGDAASHWLVMATLGSINEGDDKAGFPGMRAAFARWKKEARRHPELLSSPYFGMTILAQAYQFRDMDGVKLGRQILERSETFVEIEGTACFDLMEARIAGDSAKVADLRESCGKSIFLSGYVDIEPILPK